MIPTILLVRHAETALNDPSNERVRGYSDVPIDHNGVRKTEEIGKFLKDFPVVHIFSSPLQRALLSAQIIGNAVGATVVPNRGCLPWNLGDYTEKPIAEVGPKMDHLQNYPDIKAPNGESYRQFYDRWTEALENMLAFAELHRQENLLGVVHSRNLLSLPSILGSKKIGDVPVKGGPNPASVTRVYKDGKWKFEVIYE